MEITFARRCSYAFEIIGGYHRWVYCFFFPSFFLVQEEVKINPGPERIVAGVVDPTVRNVRFRIRTGRAVYRMHNGQRKSTFSNIGEFIHANKADDLIPFFLCPPPRWSSIEGALATAASTGLSKHAKIPIPWKCLLLLRRK